MREQTSAATKLETTMYTMVRSGDFYAIPMGNLHCGDIQPGKPHRFTYTVRCEASQLDSRGFIVDQLMVHNQFENIGEFRESCELLARIMAYRILDLATKLDLVNVSVSPASNASVSFTAKRKARKVPGEKYADYFDWQQPDSCKLPIGVAVGGSK